MRTSACVNGTRPVWADGCWRIFDDNIYRSEWWSGLIGILLANCPITLPPFVDGISPGVLVDKNDDVLGIVENVLSINECPSEEPLLIIVERSFSDIVRVNNDDCWDTIAGSSDDDESRGMFEFEPDIEYNDDGIAVDDCALDWDILLRICWGRIPVKKDNHQR